MFQSTHPRGVRLSGAVKSPGAFLGFNPRTRVGCDCGCWCGPTASSRFNPRTRVGCDSRRTWPKVASCSFQSTHPRGVRHDVVFGYQNRYDVSIHAPAWGATFICYTAFILIDSFNPRTRVGCDPSRISVLPRPGRFQSTHPRGVRPERNHGPYAKSSVSIHAPAWGATGACVVDSGYENVSIHAPAWGATVSSAAAAARMEVSIHAPAWGATRGGLTQHAFGLVVSIHAPAWGATVSMFYPVDSRD